MCHHTYSRNIRNPSTFCKGSYWPTWNLYWYNCRCYRGRCHWGSSWRYQYLRRNRTHQRLPKLQRRQNYTHRNHCRLRLDWRMQSMQDRLLPRWFHLRFGRWQVETLHPRRQKGRWLLTVQPRQLHLRLMREQVESRLSEQHLSNLKLSHSSLCQSRQRRKRQRLYHLLRQLHPHQRSLRPFRCFLCQTRNQRPVWSLCLRVPTHQQQVHQETSQLRFCQRCGRMCRL